MEVQREKYKVAQAGVLHEYMLALPEKAGKICDKGRKKTQITSCVPFKKTCE